MPIAFFNRLLPVAAICVGAAVTFCVYGYQFGQGNHGVYLLDALREAQPTLLQNDWFTTHTLQYHIVFTKLSAALMHLGIIQPAFLVIYISLILLFHIAWRGIIHHLGGQDAAYLLSVALYHLSAAGTALGMYQFFQDSSVLPGNIAAVAMLWAIWMWITDRKIAAGICFGIAGVFHLNFAVVGIGLWAALSLMYLHDRGSFRWAILSHLKSRELLLGSLAALVPSLINIGYAARSKLTRSGGMPLNEFIDLYVRLRHPHHYDPSSWPAGIWVALMWTLIPAILLLRGQLLRIYFLFMFLVVVALLGAGLVYVNETLVQMSLYRFSIYLQLLGCACAGVLIERSLTIRKPSHATVVPFLIGASICAGIATVCLVQGPFYGLFRMPKDDADYIRLCQWVSRNTPVEAVFLVPPDEESMRLIGQRAIIVNYKSVPQLSTELAEWRTRLCDLLNIRDLSSLPHGYTRIFPALRAQYEQVSSMTLENAARKYAARYIVATHPLDSLPARRINTEATGRYILYDLND